jgi:hypothetical protein
VAGHGNRLIARLVTDHPPARAARAKARLSVQNLPIEQADLDHANLVYASVSLPFLARRVFPATWHRIQAVLLPGGVLAADLFGLNDS